MLTLLCLDCPLPLSTLSEKKKKKIQPKLPGIRLKTGSLWPNLTIALLLIFKPQNTQNKTLGVWMGIKLFVNLWYTHSLTNHKALKEKSGTWQNSPAESGYLSSHTHWQRKQDAKNGQVKLKWAKSNAAPPPRRPWGLCDWWRHSSQGTEQGAVRSDQESHFKDELCPEQYLWLCDRAGQSTVQGGHLNNAADHWQMIWMEMKLEE